MLSSKPPTAMRVFLRNTPRNTVSASAAVRIREMEGETQAQSCRVRDGYGLFERGGPPRVHNAADIGRTGLVQRSTAFLI